MWNKTASITNAEMQDKIKSLIFVKTNKCPWVVIFQMIRKYLTCRLTRIMSEQIPSFGYDNKTEL